MNDSLDNEEIDVLEEYISENNLKITKQRRTVLKIFLECNNHVSVEELYNIVLKTEPKIGLATVYRTLALLTKSGLALEMDFGDGQKRYESSYKSVHHDHMVCTECGKILEFNHPLIEKYQEEVAMQKNFKITSHKLDLFGLCQDCK
jgi:Fur family ferric uptake transcriptional regulator